ncbi:phage tail protein [Sphingomonas sp. SUN039]|uniref:phage tail protein n=1 Tax=Sphingomonas sp. SUN039 TaxID=2937787 RepID=UPI0021648E8F|nr:tail fiber protein [Sphingomonas sp. SUN039]UVO55770.1 tail fiber protein [Sphingomonas sp. SUN039]
MGTPFLGELRLMSFNFAPKGWAFCNGQLLPINQNQALFSLLGTMYGGNGVQNFALPNLQGRSPIHVGNGFTQGQAGGEEAHTLLITEMPSHNHVAQASNAVALANPAGIIPTNTKAVAQGLVALAGGATTPAQIYGTGVPSGTMSADTISNTGGSQGHENRQPFTVLSWCIALQGVFPSRN